MIAKKAESNNVIKPKKAHRPTLCLCRLTMTVISYMFVGALAFFLGLLGCHYRYTKGIARRNTAVDGPANVEDVSRDVIVVGAGVAGSALAYALGKDGRRVHVIERDLTEPDRIVGELLQPGGYIKLLELGLGDCAEGIDSQRILGYALFKKGKSAKMAYPLERFHVDVAGRSFHHGRFVQRLRGKAASLSNVLLEQGTVTSLIQENGVVKGVLYKNRVGEESKACAPLTIVCDGCFSNLRRSLCNSKVEVLSHFVGLILDGCQLPYPNYTNVMLADSSLVLFYPISSSQIRCLVDVPGNKIPSISNGEMENHLLASVAPQVPVELRDAFASAVKKKGKLRSMPNINMAARSCTTPGVMVIGDALNMRHAVVGGGMTVALSDVVVLANLLKPLRHLNDAVSLSKYLESFYIRRKPVASSINATAGVYKILRASQEEAMEALTDVCFDYLCLGRTLSDGPMASISGLDSRPASLILHFSSLAFYGLIRLVVPFPSPKLMWHLARLTLGVGSIGYSIARDEGIRQMFFPWTLPAYHRTPPANLVQWG